MMDWIPVIVLTLLFSLLIYLLGTVIIFCSGARKPFWYILSPLVACFFLGASALFSPVFGWNIFSILVMLVVVLAVILGVRVGVSRGSLVVSLQAQLRSLRQALAPSSSLLLAGIAGGVLVNLIFLIINYAVPAGSPTVLIQNYDTPFHYSVIRHILEAGNASPIGAGSVMGTQTAIYPSLWHGMVALICQLFSITLEEGVWVCCFAITGCIAPVGCAAVTVVLSKRSTWYGCLGTAAFCTVVPTSLTVFCFNFGCLFANCLGLALLPFAVAGIVRAFGEEDEDRKRLYGVRVAVLLASVGATGFAHPNTTITLMVLLLPFFMIRCRNWAQRIVLLIVYGGGWLLLFSSSLFQRTVNCVDRVGYSAKHGNAVLSILGIDYTQFASSIPMVIAFCVIPLIILCLLAWAIRKRWSGSWYLASIGICTSLFMFTMFPENPAAILFTGFWYRDIPRMIVITSFMLLPLIGVIFQGLVSFVMTRFRGRSAQVIGCMLCSVLVLGVWGVMALRPTGIMPTYIANYGKGDACLHDYNDLSLAQRDFAEEIAPIVGNDVVLNNYNDGSVWLYPAYGINALIKGRPANQMSSMDEDLYTLVTGVDKIGENSDVGRAVREAAANLDLEYVVKMSDAANATTRFNDDNQIAYGTADAIQRVDEQTPGLECIYKSNGCQLYRVIVED